VILRRITEHVKAENWFAVGVDFLIVVVGVFIGIQVSNWNEERADLRRGEQFVERLIADLTRDHRQRTELLAYYDQVSTSAIRAIALLNAPSANDRELVVNSYRATELAYDPQTRATWDEIVSSGEIGLLPRVAVEQGLNLYFSVDVAEQTRQEISNSRLRSHVRSIVPHDVQAAIRAGCSDIVASDGRVLGFVEECRLDVPPEAIAVAAETLKADAQLLQFLTLHVSALASARNNLGGDIFSIGRSLELLRDAGDAGAQREDKQAAGGSQQ